MAIKFRLLVPVDQTPLEVDHTEDGKIVVSAAWLGHCKSWILDARELGNFMDQFRNDPNSGSRFYVERIDED